MMAKSPALLALLLACSACQQHGPMQVTHDGASLGAARQALDEGSAGTALAIARGILSSQPNNVAALTQAGNAQAALGDRLGAEASYRQALQLAPQDTGALLGMAKLKIRDDVHGAELAFRAILASKPKDAVALNDLGYVLDLQERHLEAQSYYQLAIASDPDRIGPRINLALSLALSGQAARAEQMLRDLSASARSSQKARLDLAFAQVMAGHDKEAAATLANELSPDDSKAALVGMQQLKPAIAVK